MTTKHLLAALVAFGLAASTASADEPSTKSLLKSANNAKNDKDFEAAIKLYDRVLARERDNMEAIRSMAWIRNDQEKFDLAMFWCKEGFNVDASDGSLLTEAGYASWKLGNTAMAKKYLKKAINAQPRTALAYNYLIKILKDDGESKAALAIEDLRDENGAK